MTDDILTQVRAALDEARSDADAGASYLRQAAHAVEISALAPALVAEVERLRAQVAAVRAAADHPARVTLLHAGSDTDGYAVVWPEDLHAALDGEVADADR